MIFSFLFVKEQVDACSKWHTGMSSEVQSYKVQNRPFFKNQNFLDSFLSGANLKFPPEEICVMIREKEWTLLCGKQIAYHKYLYLLASLRLFSYISYNYSVVVFNNDLFAQETDKSLHMYQLFFNHYCNSTCVCLAAFLGQNLLDCKFTLRPRISAQNEGTGRLDSIHGCIPRAFCFVFQWKGKTSHPWNQLCYFAWVFVPFTEITSPFALHFCKQDIIVNLSSSFLFESAFNFHAKC